MLNDVMIVPKKIENCKFGRIRSCQQVFFVFAKQQVKEIPRRCVVLVGVVGNVKGKIIGSDMNCI